MLEGHSVSLAVGTRLAQYEVLAFIGAGGMGEVYRAHDSRLGRDVALKVLPSALAHDPDMRSRFEHEARAVASISHQNIMAIHELAMVADQPVAVVELLEGESLRTRLSRGPMAWRDAALMAARIADGLAAAHAKGIVHRDLKPENVFITDEMRPKILDFGLAHSEPAFAAVASEATYAATEPGRVLGTVGYMAPEQIRGEPVSAATDVFAFGCTLTEMLTGEKPFMRSTAAASLAAVLHDEAPNVLASGRDIPPRLGDIIKHCLEKDVARRFASARDVAAALRSLLVDTSSQSLTAPKRSRRTRAIAVLPFASLDADPNTEYLADGVTESIINSLSQLPKLRVVPRSTVFAYRGRQVNPRSVGLALNVDSLVTGRVVQQGGVLNVQAELVDIERETQVWGDQYRHPTSDLLALQEQIAWQVSEALRVQLTGTERKRLRKQLKERPTENSEAYHEYLRGRHAWAKWTRSGFQDAVRHFEAAIEKDPVYARAYAGLGDTFGVMGYYGHLPPEVAMTRASAAAYKALELDPTLAEAHSTMAMTRMFYYWDWIGAEQSLKKAIELDARYPTAHMLQGLLHSLLGRHDEGLRAAKRARELDPLSLVMLMGVTWALFFARRYREALDSLREVTIIDPQFPEALNMLVLTYERLGLFDLAAEALAQAGGSAAMPVSDEAIATLKNRYATGGERGYWQARFDIIRHMDPCAGQTSCGAAAWLGYASGALAAQAGDADSAIAGLERAAAQRSGHIVFLQVDPCFDPIRHDPRFESFVRRMGFPTAVTLP
jgi:serine/threonine protein kinase